MTKKSKGQEYNPKRYSVKKTRNKTQAPELEAETNFEGLWSDLEGFILDIGPRAL